MTTDGYIYSPRVTHPVSREWLNRAVRESTIASAKIEGRVIPPDYVRPASVTKFLRDRHYDA
ncbi:hypothetical protein [Mycetocola saprophilus]|uniref:hypothetical protein n=1 Tax=Mycetocola saprophilus TaxID=76636 RepID=UPI0004BEE848|nr:hypothetical protein [Mycetocola saprophilus]